MRRRLLADRIGDDDVPARRVVEQRSADVRWDPESRAVADGREPLGPHLIASSASINTVVYGFHVDIVKTMRSRPGALDEKKRGIMYGP